MIVGVCTLAIHLPLARSLKDKRQIVKSLKDRLRRHNVSVAEVDCQDLWQRTVLGIAAVAGSRPPLERLFQDILAEVEGRIPGEIVDRQIDYL
ncbi:MAG TPA: DUF503 domain-containing protein [Candidatus Polarisedimenticolia bacterium]|nr:DUF503 domain-containing protein [Candidatus Polarisedimenticolia bacterium]